MHSRLTLHAAPAAGYDQPFEMLAGCHQRVERTLGLMERLAVHLRQHGCDADARHAAADVMRYFDLAAPAHHEDEERHVFPALAARGDDALRALVQRLQHEHVEMTRHWQALRTDLAGVCAGTLPEAAAAQRWPAFAALYRAHLQAEDTLAYPAAQPLLDAEAQRVMGHEMATRRGATCLPP